MTKQVNKNQENKPENFIFRGIITGTSNKISTEFANDNPRKTAYIKVDADNKAILEAKGLTMYTSQEGDDFFIIKLAEKVTAWVDGEAFEIATHIGTDNFNTEDIIQIGCIKGKNKGNNYVRIYALGLQTMDDVILIEKENPFAKEFTPSNENIPF